MNTEFQRFATCAASACGASDQDELRVCNMLSEQFVRHAHREKPLTVKERQKAEQKIVKRVKRAACSFGIVETVVISILIRIATEFFVWAWKRLFSDGGHEEVSSIAVSIGA